MNGVDVLVRPYAEGDLWLLERTLGDPTQMVNLNGPESIEHIRKRHGQFLAMSADPHAGCQFTILAGPLHSQLAMLDIGKADGKTRLDGRWDGSCYPNFSGGGRNCGDETDYRLDSKASES
jgi:hypothetical protein